MSFPNVFQRTSVVLLSAAAFAAGPQTGTQNPPPEKHLIRRGPVEPDPQLQGPLLTFNLVAFDSKGEPFPSLRDTDLDIRDDGKSMQAVFCHPVVSAKRPSEAGPNEFTNRRNGAAPESTLILLDLLNANLDERGAGWYELVNTIRKLESGRNVYLYLLTKEAKFYPIHALPGVQSPRLTDDEDWALQIKQRLDQAMRAVDRLRPWEFQSDRDARVRRTVSVLGDLASDFGSQPGRKSLVWISHGVPILAVAPNGLRYDYTPLVTDLGTSMARSGITVYAVDQMSRAEVGTNSMDTLQTLAGLTGGQWLSSNAIEEAIRQAMHEGPATYQVGYRPPLNRWDGKFHKLRITAQGAGGIKLRIRTIEGYFGDPREANPSDRVALAALGPVDDSGIGIQATAVPSESVKGWIQFQAWVDASDLHLTSGATYTGEFTVALAYYADGQWQPDLSAEMTKSLQLTPAEHEAVLQKGTSLSFSRPMPNGASKVRIVVRDAQSPAVGSLTIPIGLPQP